MVGDRFAQSAGGKGANQAVAAARADAIVTFISKVGADEFGRKSVASYEREGIRCDFITTHPSAPSGVALIMVGEHGENLIGITRSANEELSDDDVAAAKHAIKECDVILLQLEIPIRTVAFTAHLAKSFGKIVILNPAPHRALPRSLLRAVTILTPNEIEAESLGDVSPIVVETRGARGAVIRDDRGEKIVPGFKVKAVDTVAAGDCFSGCLAVALGEGQPLLDAVRFANAAAAISTTRHGAQPSLPTRAEIERFLRSRE